MLEAHVPLQVETETEEHWQKLIKMRPLLFDGAAWCLRSYEVKGGELILDMQESSFKYLLYTHHTLQGRLLIKERRMSACGLMALTETTDGLLVLGRPLGAQHLRAFPRRGRDVEFPLYFHCVPAGVVDAARPLRGLEVHEKEVPSLAEIVEKELDEDHQPPVRSISKSFCVESTYHHLRIYIILSIPAGLWQELGISWPMVTACRFVSLMDGGDEQGRAK